MNPKHNWTPQELEKLKQEFPHRKTDIIAAEICLHYNQVCNMAYKLGLKKTEAFLHSPECNRLDGIKGASTRFVKGQPAYNKAVTMSQELRERVKHTWFESGHKPHNTKFDGYERISEDGYREVRISEGNFEFLHRKNWEDVYGPIPEGYIVVFRDGDRLNCESENLELITRKENMKRNSIARYPKELIKLINTHSKLKRQINGKK